MNSNSSLTGQAILCVPHHHSSFLEMVVVAHGLRERLQAEPVFVIQWQDSSKTVDMCQWHNFQYRLWGPAERHANPKPQRSPASSAGKLSFRPKVVAKLQQFFAGQVVLHSLYFYRTRQAAGRLLDEMAPACIVLMGDRHIGLETCVVREANDRCIPSLIIPFAIFDPGAAMTIRQRQPNWQDVYGMDNWLNRFFAYLRPTWNYTQDNLTMLWHPASEMVAATLLRVMPSNPWALGGGHAWCMAAENERARQALEQQGVLPEKLIVTGKARLDEAAELWQNQATARPRICAELGLDPARPLLVCSVPQLAEHELLPWPEHWREIEFLFSSLKQAHPAVNVVLSLHPKSDAAQYAPLAEKHGMLIARQHTFDQLVPICDAFVATFSSTVTLAIACHKPAIVIDFYGLNYDLFDGVSGTIVVRDRAAFVPTLQRMFSDKAYYERLVNGQAEAAPTWARFDGRATERIVEMVAELAVRGKAIQKLPPRQRRRALPAWSR